VVQELAHCFDIVSSLRNRYVCILGLTNRLSSIDSSLRRTGRFEVEIEVKVPSPSSRDSIIRSLMPVEIVTPSPSADEYEAFIRESIEQTQGFVIADIVKWIKESFLLENSGQSVSLDTLRSALSCVVPSLLRG
jgi:SpoVK/Ycf46/Vps4 family AAA+-type ATPase